MREYAGKMKGLIPAAGMGTRLKPITLAIPKELLMVGDKAIIEYVIDAMKMIGIDEIIIVVGWRKHAILDYLGSGERLGVKFTYVVQDKRDGLGRAVYSAKHALGNEPFFVVLGDNFFYPQIFLKEILEFHKLNNSDATIGVTNIEDPTRHGIIKTGEYNKIIDIVEKPSPKVAPSNLGCIGIYIFNSDIFDAICKTQPGYNNEIQLTDAIKILIENGKNVYYKKIEGKHIDIGTLNDFRRANDFLLKQ
jgi:glucose-1-phosphate thymidylyltransferase long form